MANPNTAENPTRAVPVLQLTPGSGSELTFYQSTGITVEHTETHAIRYTTEFKSATSLGISIGIPLIGLGIGQNFAEEQTIEYQTTAEMAAIDSFIRAAQCYLIRNQNDPHTGPLNVYYDTVFGTFLFLASTEQKGCTSIRGSAIIGRQPTSYAIVSIVDRGNKLFARTVTDKRGQFDFHCVTLKPGRYGLAVNDVEKVFEIPQVEKATRPIRIEVEGVRRRIDPRRIPIGELSEILGVSQEKIAQARQDVVRAKKASELWKLFGQRFSRDRVDRAYTVASPEADKPKQYPSHLVKSLASRKRGRRLPPGRREGPENPRRQR